EMLSGLGPFGGETVTDSLGAILHREPNWTLLPPGTPALVQVLLRRCLAKDRKRRLHDIGDARIDLDQAIDDPAGTTLGFAPRSTHGARPTLRTLLPWGVTALALAAAGAGLWWGGAFGTTAPAHLAARLIIPSSTPAYQRASRPIISPDGRSIVFNARAADTGIWCFWHRPLDSFDARPLPETANAFAPAWSPDGRSIAFHAEGKLWALDLEQGGARRLLAAEPGSDGVSWSSAGTLLISRFVGGPEGLGGMVSLPAAGGTAQPLTRLDATAHERGHLFGHFLPDGQRYIYLAIFRRPDQEISVGRVYAGRLGSDERTHVADLTSKVWYADPGWLVYVDDAAIKALRFDPATCRTRGEPVLIADGVGYFRPTGNTDLSVSRTGNLVFTPPVADRRLVWFDTAGTPVGGIGPTADFQGFRISPDGARVAAAVVERRTGLSDLWVYGVARPTSTRLTTEASWEGAPVWSADGRTIFYASDKADSPEVYTIPADGSKGATRLYGPGSGGRVWMPRTASPDGRVLMVNGVVEKLDEELRVLPLDGTGPAVPFRSSPAAEDGGRFSPDGRWVAFESDESGRREVYLGPYPGPGASVQVSDGGSYPVWAPRGDRLYYIKSKLGTAAATEPSRIMAVDLKDAAAFATPPAARVFIETTDIIDSFDAAPDGQRLLVQLSPAQTEPIRVILNALPARE
ncbi:MAG: hypothetical protein ACKVS8_01030, partial [Phycisphaerales bacterium]